MVLEAPDLYTVLKTVLFPLLEQGDPLLILPSQRILAQERMCLANLASGYNDERTGVKLAANWSLSKSSSSNGPRERLIPDPTSCWIRTLVLAPREFPS